MNGSVVPRLDDLIAGIESKVGDPLQRLSAAVMIAHTLDELADHLIGHFVDRARQAGASWTQVGQSLGVTKQAAQKRFVPAEPETAEVDLRIFARYADRARVAIVGAQEQARRRGGTEIRPGDVVLALLEDEQTQRVLGEIEVDAVRTAIGDALGRGGTVSQGAIPFSPASKKGLELGHREALRRNSEHVEPEHILLGVLGMAAEPDIAAAGALGLDTQRVEARIPAGSHTPASYRA